MGIPQKNNGPNRNIRRRAFAYLRFLLAMAVMFSPATALCAGETRLSFAPSGKPMFNVRFFDEGERYDAFENASRPNLSPWTLSPELKDEVMGAVGLWGEILGPGSRNDSPVLINVGTYNLGNADAWSQPNSGRPHTAVADSIISGLQMEAPARIRIGLLDFSTSEHPYPIPLSSRWESMPVVFHEMGHALGIASFANQFKLSPGRFDIRRTSEWDSHLYDRYGTRLMPGMELLHELIDDGTHENVFIVGWLAQSGVVFRGEHVSEVLDGAMGNGLTIEGFEHDGTQAYPELSHIELERGLMSHQYYRNYTTLMEAELAVLQDIGYELDRRNFYGRSVYGDGGTIVNANGFFGRDEAGTHYIEGMANTSSLGVGLHVYGKRNDITQAADLLADGTAGTGIRVDGSGNTLRLAKDVRVTANGDHGTGLLVSYGKDQEILSDGDILALGEGGIGARFDFGHNVIGDDLQYRGSWMYTSQYDDPDNYQVSDASDSNGYELNLDGPLVKRFDVGGRLSGSSSSIYISENALVQNINFLSGASVSGDLVSLWNPENPLIQYEGSSADLHTALAFGLTVDHDTAAAPVADEDFSMVFDGGIHGLESLDMSLAAGYLQVTGPVEVYRLENEGRLALLGLSNGRGASVAESFTNGASATFETGFNAQGEVAGVVADAATLDGTWRLTPLRDYYTTGRIEPEAAVTLRGDGTVTGDFSSVELTSGISPTLEFTLGSAVSASPTVDVVRQERPYSRSAAGETGRCVGMVLDGLSLNAQGDMKELFAALDFSAVDGGEISAGLPELSAESYDILSLVWQSYRRELNLSVSRHLLETSVPLRDGWRAWSDASVSWKNGRSADWKSFGISVLAGMDHVWRNGSALGFHASYGYRDTAVQGTNHGNAFSLGFHAIYRTESPFYLSAQTNFEVERNAFAREIRINGFERRNNGGWTALGAGASLDFGLDWHVGGCGIGPIARLEYDFLRRPAIAETGEGSTRLVVEEGSYNSLSLFAGFHVDYGWESGGSSMSFDLLALWRHELLQDAFHSTANFIGQEASFRSAVTQEGVDSLVLRGGLRIGTDRLALDLKLGGEFFGAAETQILLGIGVDWALR